MILGTDRAAIICEARQLYWLVLRDRGFTLQAIGRLSGRTHAAVLKGIIHFEGLLSCGDKRAQLWYDRAKRIA